MPSDRFRKNLKTPLRLRDSLPASRPRMQGVMSQPSPAPSNVPSAVVQSPLRGGVYMEAGPSLAPAAPGVPVPAPAVDSGSPTRFFPTTWWNLSSTMKLVLVHQVGEEIGGETVEAQNKAMRYLGMSDDEMNDLCDLDEREYARAVQFEADTAAYDNYLLSLPLTATALNPVQSQQLAELEKKQMDNMKAEALAGALVKQEDVEYAQRFVQERAPTDTPLRRAILSALERHVGQDYVKEPISTFLRPNPDSDDE
jgi:hypothetical protein